MEDSIYYNDSILEEVLVELNNIADLEDVTREYEEESVKFIKVYKNIKIIEKILKLIIDNPKYQSKVRYAAFFILCTLYRRNKNYTRYYTIIKDIKYLELFGTYISYGHLKSMCLIEIANARNEIFNAIQCSKRVIDETKEFEEELLTKGIKIKINYGFHHSYSVNVCKAFEDGYLVLPKDSSYMTMAKEYVTDAIAKYETYARFHYTLGRLYLIEKEYDDAVDEFKIAIDFEDSSSSDYALRISDYQTYLLRAKTYKNMEELNFNIVSQVNKEMESLRAKNIEILSFFVAVLSFIIGGIQLASSSTTFGDKASLIILLFGSLLLVLSTFGKNLTESKSTKYILSLTLGAIMMAVSIILHIYIK